MMLSISIGILAHADQSVTLAWDSSPDATVAGYFVYYGQASGVYAGRVDVGRNTTAMVPGLKEGQTYYFAVTAYDDWGLESVSSNEVVFTVPGLLLGLIPPANPGDPPALSFPIVAAHWGEIQTSVDLETWTTVGQTETATSNVWVRFIDPQAGTFRKRFYRLVLH